jgi:thiosulfate/3-mercaptopyruvate sulfurtransferase
MMNTKLPGVIVDTDWLEENLHNPDVRIIDSHYFLEYTEDGVSLTSGRSAWEKSHIPGSLFVDLLEELSDKQTELPFMMPSASQFADVMSRNGADDGSAVVIYDRTTSMWASRLWLMLKECGFNNAAVLDGGWTKWVKDKKPVTAEKVSHPSAAFTCKPRTPSLFTTKEEVLEAIDNKDVSIICALEKEIFEKGHIPTSLTVPSHSLVDPDDNTFLPVEQLETIFAKAGVNKHQRIITYCGGGIAGSCDAFILLMLGCNNVALYDGSMEEWSRHPELPIEETAS